MASIREVAEVSAVKEPWRGTLKVMLGMASLDTMPFVWRVLLKG